MRRHSFRWSSLGFGLAFAAIIATRLAWNQDLPLLGPRELGVAAAIVLIILGATGMIITLARDRTSEGEHDDQTPDSQQ